MSTATGDSEAFRVGFISIVGRPNVGKSTLLNRLAGQKLSIVSNKAQTTRHRITAVRNEAQAQLIFVDTPGFQREYNSALNRAMNRTVINALHGIDVILMVVEAGRFTAADKQVVQLLPSDIAVILVINKVDRLRERDALLPFIAEVSPAFPFAEIIPLSARSGRNLPTLLECLRPRLPLGEPLFDEEAITDRSERFLAAEFLREQLFRLLGDELPYGVAVEIEKFELEGELRRIYAAIIVDRSSHKAMVIGRGGGHLKRISSQARAALETLFDGRVYLEVWVKVRSGWADDERALKSLGYDENSQLP